MTPPTGSRPTTGTLAPGPDRPGVTRGAVVDRSPGRPPGWQGEGVELPLTSGPGADPFGGSGSSPFDGPAVPGFPDTSGFPGTSGFPDGSGAGGFATLTAVVLGVMALVAVVVVLSGVRQVVRARRRAAEVRSWRVRGRTTTGTVVDNRMQSHRRAPSLDGPPVGARSSLSFSPVVRFEVDGHPVTVAGDQVSHRSFLPGRPAEVVYDPAAPERAHVVAEGGGAFGGGVSGALLIGSGVLFLVVLAVVARLSSTVL